MSKHEQLSMQIIELEQKNISIDLIAIQETWDVKYPELIALNGFQPFVCKRRRNMRGGGIGFYVKKGIQLEVIDNLSPFENKIIEALTLRLTYPSNKTVFVSSIYRSNGVIPNVTASQQLDRFLEKFSLLLSDLKTTNKNSLVFLDSNINLININQQEVSQYLNSIFENLQILLF